MAKMNGKPKLLFQLCIAFFCGLLAGIALTIVKLDNSEIKTPQVKPLNLQALEQQTKQAITTLETAVRENPEDIQAWTRLGHLYFDSNNPEKAVKAYERVIALNGADADLYTDLGIMYRRMKMPQKAVDAFDYAIKMDKTHQYSRLNKGIVLLFDLKKNEQAFQEWEELLEINPDIKMVNGDFLKDALNQLKSQAGQ